MKDYIIGQIVYVVLKRQMCVYPVQIIEVITKRTLNGEDISYKVRGGTDPNTQVYLNELEGEVFESDELAKSTLTERAVASISKLITSAVQKAREWYPESFAVPTEQKQDSTNEFMASVAAEYKAMANTVEQRDAAHVPETPVPPVQGKRSKSK